MEKKTNSWKLKEIIMVAMICIVFGGVYLAGVYLSSFIAAALTPAGLSPLGNEIVFGVWFMAATLAGYILQKPGAAVVAEVIAAVIEVLLGNWFGPMVIVAGIIQGAGAELVFAAYKYKKFNGGVMYLAAAGSCVTSFLWSFVRSGYGQFSVLFLALLFVIRLISSLIFAGFICKLIGDGLAKTGLLKGYELGRSHE